MNKRTITILNLLVVMMVLTTTGCEGAIPVSGASIVSPSAQSAAAVLPVDVKPTAPSPNTIAPVIQPTAENPRPVEMPVLPQASLSGNLYLAIDETGYLFKPSQDETQPPRPICDPNLNRYKLPLALMSLLENSTAPQNGKVSVSFIPKSKDRLLQIESPVSYLKKDNPLQFVDWKNQLRARIERKEAANRWGFPLYDLLEQVKSRSGADPFVLFTDGNFVNWETEKILLEDTKKVRELFEKAPTYLKDYFHIVLVCPNSLTKEMKDWWMAVDNFTPARVHWMTEENYLAELYNLLSLVLPAPSNQISGWGLLSSGNVSNQTGLYSLQPWADDTKSFIKDGYLFQSLPADSFRFDWRLVQLLQGDVSEIGREVHEIAWIDDSVYKNKGSPINRTDNLTKCKDSPYLDLKLPRMGRGDIILYTWATTRHAPFIEKYKTITPQLYNPTTGSVFDLVVTMTAGDGGADLMGYDWTAFYKCHDYTLTFGSAENEPRPGTPEVMKDENQIKVTFAGLRIPQTDLDSGKFSAEYNIKIINKSSKEPNPITPTESKINFYYYPIFKSAQADKPPADYKNYAYAFKVEFDLFGARQYPPEVFNALVKPTIEFKKTNGGACSLPKYATNQEHVSPPYARIRHTQGETFFWVLIEEGKTSNPQSCDEMTLSWDDPWKPLGESSQKWPHPSVSCTLWDKGVFSPVCKQIPPK